MYLQELNVPAGRCDSGKPRCTALTHHATQRGGISHTSGYKRRCQVLKEGIECHLPNRDVIPPTASNKLEYLWIKPISR